MVLEHQRTSKVTAQAISAEPAQDRVMVTGSDALRERAMLALTKSGFRVERAIKAGRPTGSVHVLCCDGATAHRSFDAGRICVLVGHDAPCPHCDWALGLHANLWVPERLIELQLGLAVRGLTRLAHSRARVVKQFGFDAKRSEVKIDSKRVQLRKTEFRLLAYLARRSGEWVSQETILRDVFEARRNYDTALVRVHVHSLRRALGAHAACLESERGYGYRLCPQPQATSA